MTRSPRLALAVVLVIVSTGATGLGGRAAQRGRADSRMRTTAVIRQVDQARLSAATSSAVAVHAALRGRVVVRGTTVSVQPGSSLWLLSNGAFAIVAGGTTAPDAAAIARDKLDDGDLAFVACSCRQAGTGGDCTFDGAPRPASCRPKAGAACACAFSQGVIGYDGTTRGRQQWVIDSDEARLTKEQ